MSFTVTDVKVWPLKKPNDKVKANGVFVVNDALKVKYTLFKGQKGLFVGLPGKYGDNKEGKKEWYPDVQLINEDAQKVVNAAVLKEYNKVTGNTAGLSQGKAAGPSSQVEDEDELPF